jgi:hypothetical protein
MLTLQMRLSNPVIVGSDPSGDTASFYLRPCSKAFAPACCRTNSSRQAAWLFLEECVSFCVYRTCLHTTWREVSTLLFCCDAQSMSAGSSLLLPRYVYMCHKYFRVNNGRFAESP